MPVFPLLPLLLLRAASPAGAASGEPSGTYVVQCTFSNPAYSGRCTVNEETPRAVPPPAACRVILGCLNDVRCVTKTYCNATTVRGGWKLESSGTSPQK